MTLLDARGVWRMFQDIAFSYDFQNSALSLGRDTLWRKRLVRDLALGNTARVLDAACGTGEAAREIKRRHPEARVVGLDFSPAMLGQARSKGLTALTAGDCLALPFPEAAFDAATIVFGIRNIARRDTVLGELRRVLRPGGTLLVMEFGYPDRQPLRWLYRLYFNHVLPPLGNALSRTDYAYTYLRDSVAAFPDDAAFLAEIRAAGFAGAGVAHLTFGVARLFSATKPRDHAR